MMQYFEEFAWAVPHGFTEPLGKCHFEQGDTLYNTKSAYQQPWGEAKKTLLHSVQVVSPVRSQAKTTKEDSEAVFAGNWQSEVVFDLYNYPSGTKKRITTTQGRLYSLLWKGNISDIETTDPLPLPMTAKAVMKKLEEIEPFVQQVAAPGYDYLYYFAYDVTNTRLSSKSRKIETSLGKNQDIDYQLSQKSARQMQLTFAGKCLPTLTFTLFSIKGKPTAVKQSLKNALYQPSKNRKTKQDNFRLRTHGKLISL